MIDSVWQMAVLVIVAHAVLICAAILVTRRNDIVRRADEFAERHFRAVDKRRKYTGEPYMAHPREVAAIVRSVPHTPVMLAAALLHDTVEDTDVELSEIRETFGPEVAWLVYWLTDPEVDGNRARRKRAALEQIAVAPAEAQTIKLADLISNSRSILERDPEFARVYMREKAALLTVLTSGDPTLLAEARKIVADWKAVQS